MCIQLKMELSDSQLQAMISTADPNGDGQLSFDEFVVAIQAQMAAGKGGGLVAVAEEASSAFGWLNPISWFASTQPESAAPVSPPALQASPLASQPSPPASQLSPPRSQASASQMSLSSPGALTHDATWRVAGMRTPPSSTRNGWERPQSFEPSWGDTRPTANLRPPLLIQTHHEQAGRQERPRQPPSRVSGPSRAGRSPENSSLNS